MKRYTINYQDRNDFGGEMGTDKLSEDVITIVCGRIGCNPSTDRIEFKDNCYIINSHRYIGQFSVRNNETGEYIQLPEKLSKQIIKRPG